MDKYVQAAEANQRYLVVGGTNGPKLLVVGHPELDADELRTHPAFKPGPGNTYLLR